ncbi:hypothetical protein ACFSGX_06620 [Sphingomonas arantia]|uniref:Metal-dependent HD superfamily phosphohydrolase n=1 Tax=Sphingomonas arantia TaxID=1460676 RepID=A0ABW4TYS2_9SPHN
MHTDHPAWGIPIPADLAARVPDTLLVQLRARHDAPLRAYHDWAHIQTLLTLLIEVRPLLHDEDAVLWAILYHDAIYDPRAPDNEERSAQLLETELSGRLDPATLARAAMLTRATARHLLPDADASIRSDAALFLDMDLSILAAPQDRFDGYETDIRHEYAHVPDDLFRAARARILTTFLERPRLFLSDWGHARFEAAARDNLRATLRRLPEPP